MKNLKTITGANELRIDFPEVNGIMFFKGTPEQFDAIVNSGVLLVEDTRADGSLRKSSIGKQYYSFKSASNIKAEFKTAADFAKEIEAL